MLHNGNKLSDYDVRDCCNEIYLDFDDIKEYAQGAINYINGYDLDKDEILTALACIQETVGEIKNQLIVYLDYLSSQVDIPYDQDLVPCVECLKDALMLKGGGYFE